MTRVAILDTGSDIKHESIRNNIINTYNSIKKNNDVFDVY